MNVNFVIIVTLGSVGDDVSVSSTTVCGLVNNEMDAEAQATRLRDEIKCQMSDYANVVVTWVRATA